MSFHIEYTKLPLSVTSAVALLGQFVSGSCLCICRIIFCHSSLGYLSSLAYPVVSSCLRQNNSMEADFCTQFGTCSNFLNCFTAHLHTVELCLVISELSLIASLWFSVAYMLQDSVNTSLHIKNGDQCMPHIRNVIFLEFSWLIFYLFIYLVNCLTCTKYHMQLVFMGM